MTIVAMGGTGLIGRQVVANLHRRVHEAVAPAPRTGVDTITGVGLDDAHVVVDLAHSPSFADEAVLEFFQTSGRNLLKAEVNAGGSPDVRR
jgi:uncharacterized protein YbjT (DUF2867 family)